RGDVGDEVLGARPVEDGHDQVVDVAIQGEGDRLQVVLHRGSKVDLPFGGRPDHDLVHVDVGGVQEPALLGGGEDGDGVGGAGSAEVRALEGVHGDVHGIPRAPHFLADEQHGGLVALPLADHDGAV